MSATLGGLIKDYRMQKNISQLEIAFALGWKEPSRLSRIEQGKISAPSRELIEQLAKAMKLDDKEKNQLLLTGGYLPTDEEIAAFRNTAGVQLENFPYPASARDFSWRIICVNNKFSDLFGLSDEFSERILQNNLWKLEVMFHSSFQSNYAFDEHDNYKRKEFLGVVLSHFYHSQRNHTHEKWYQELIKRMMDNLIFRELWIDVQHTVIQPSTIENFFDKDFFKTRDGNSLHLYYFALPAFNDPRFSVELHVPANRDAFDYLSLFAK